MGSVANIVKSYLGAVIAVAPLLFCGLPHAAAAVMEFPGASLPSASMGLGRSGDSTIGALGQDADDTTTSYDFENLNLLPDVESTQSPTDDIIDSVLGVSRSGNWLDETRNAERSRSATAFDLMKAYVNVVNNSRSGTSGGSGGRSSGSGMGFAMSLAEGINDRETLDLITRVMQPQVENDLVVFSVLGFGQFMIIGEPESGNLTVMDIASGRRTDLRSASGDSVLNRNSAAASAPAPASTAAFIPNQEETLAQFLLLFLALVSNPMFLLTTGCILSVWLLYRLAKRLS